MSLKKRYLLAISSLLMGFFLSILEIKFIIKKWKYNSIGLQIAEKRAIEGPQ